VIYEFTVLVDEPLSIEQINALYEADLDDVGVGSHGSGGRVDVTVAADSISDAIAAAIIEIERVGAYPVALGDCPEQSLPDDDREIITATSHLLRARAMATPDQLAPILRYIWLRVNAA